MHVFPDSSQILPGDALPTPFLAKVAAEYSPPAEFARTRAGWYGLLTGLCHAPAPGDVLEKVTAPEMLDQVSLLLGAEAAAPWREVAAAPDRAAIRKDFYALFKTPGPRYLTPNESVWADAVDVEGNPRPKPLLMGPSTVDAARRWERIGHTLERTSGELADYIGLELHFMEQACALEAEAWERDKPAAARFLLDQQRAFLDDHLGRWLRPLCSRMAEHALDPFYRGLGRVMPAFVAMDRSMLKLLLED